MMWVVVVVVAVTAPSAEAIDCSRVDMVLEQCINYVTNRGGTIGGCCAAMRVLLKEVRTGSDRYMVCDCLKQKASSGVHAISIDRPKLRGLPGQCNLRRQIPYVLTPNINCRSVL